MLSLNDPFWVKLDDAHRDRDIPKLLSGLSETWDDEVANSLFWDCLCHQETCYGATYAVVPHLLEIAQIDENVHQRREIALFLGFISRCAFDHREGPRGGPDEETLQGLPQTAEEWDRKLDPFRSLVAHIEAPGAEAAKGAWVDQLLSYKRVLETDPVMEHELERVISIKHDFFDAFPNIRAACERAYIEHLEDEGASQYLLSGVASADGLFDLARLLHGGGEGGFRCASCGWTFEYQLFDDLIAFYADEAPPGRHTTQQFGDRDRALSDFRSGTPARADGFILPIGNTTDVSDEQVTALLHLGRRAANGRPELLLRNFLGSFDCTNCGVRATLKSF